MNTVTGASVPFIQQSTNLNDAAQTFIQDAQTANAPQFLPQIEPYILGTDISWKGVVTPELLQPLVRRLHYHVSPRWRCAFPMRCFSGRSAPGGAAGAESRVSYRQRRACEPGDLARWPAISSFLRNRRRLPTVKVSACGAPSRQPQPAACSLRLFRRVHYRFPRSVCVPGR
jgi:hypothetical protein